MGVTYSCASLTLTSALPAARHARRQGQCLAVRASCARSIGSPSPTRRNFFSRNAWRSTWPWLPDSGPTCIQTRSATPIASTIGSLATRGPPAAGAPRLRRRVAAAARRARARRSRFRVGARPCRDPHRCSRTRPIRSGYGGGFRPRCSLALRLLSGPRRPCRGIGVQRSTGAMDGRAASRFRRARRTLASDLPRTVRRRRSRGWARPLPRRA